MQLSTSFFSKLPFVTAFQDRNFRIHLREIVFNFYQRHCVYSYATSFFNSTIFNTFLGLGSHLASAQNILFLTTGGHNGGWEAENDYVSSVIKEFSDVASCSAIPTTSIDPVTHISKTITCNQTELVNNTAMLPSIFDPGYDLVVISSAYTTIDAADWSVIKNAIATRKARGFVLFVDTINSTNTAQMLPLLNTTLGLTGASQITAGGNIGYEVDSPLNTAAIGAADFAALATFRNCGNCHTYLNVPALSALYLAPPGTSPIASGTTDALGVLIPQTQSYSGAGSCLFVTNDIGWGHGTFNLGWTENQGKVGLSFLRSFNNSTGPCGKAIKAANSPPMPIPGLNVGALILLALGLAFVATLRGWRYRN